MKIAVACDHRGLRGQAQLLPGAQEARATRSKTSAATAPPRRLPRLRRPRRAGASPSGEHDVGILMDGSGIGMSIAANKVRGVRAALRAR